MAITSNKTIFSLCSLAAAALCLGVAGAAEPVRSTQLTPSGEYTSGIEGPAVDAAGNLFVVNYRSQGTVGVWAPGVAASELALSLPEGSVGNAIRFDRKGRMFVADYKGHTVFVVDARGAAPRVYFQSSEFNQPNDLTIADDGTIFASDPNWKGHWGQVWRIDRDANDVASGHPMSSERKMSTTNGLALSPDGKTLYVGESDTREIWAYRIDGDKLVAPRLVKRFADYGIDGIRTDIDGRLHVARILKGTVAVLKPDGILVREIVMTGKEPTNLAFGGADGRTVYVTQRQGGYVETYQTDRPGREFCLQAVRCPAAVPSRLSRPAK